MSNVERIEIESEDRGFELHLWVDEDPRVSEDGLMVLNIEQVAEALYDQAKARILPHLMEMYAAKAEYDRAKRQSDTRDLSAEEFSAYLDDAYGDNWGKRVGMEQMREQGYA